MKNEKPVLRQEETETPVTSPPQKKQKDMSGKKKALWTIVFVLIAVASVWAVTEQNKNFTFAQFRSYVAGAALPWMLVAAACMLGFIFFEGLALAWICRAFHDRCRLKNGLFYSASDIYFSAITPSATGGQPVCAYFMIRDGIPTAIVTVALLANLLMYTLSILAIGLLVFLLRPGIFLSFGTPSKVLIIIGCVMQIGLAFFFTVLLKAEKLVHAIGKGLICLLSKLHLIRHKERKLERLTALIEEYKNFSERLAGHRKMMVAVFFCNLFQRVSQIAVTVAVFLATGGDPSKALDVFAMQSYVVLGSNSMPVPGAMGVSDYLMLDAFGTVMSEESAVHLELLSRTVSFYSCIVICGVASLVYYIYLKRKQRRNQI